MSIAELLAAIKEQFGMTPAAVPVRPPPPHKHGARARVAPSVSRFVRECPNCGQPMRRRLSNGARTDRYYDKSRGLMVCSACAPARVRP